MEHAWNAAHENLVRARHNAKCGDPKGARAPRGAMRQSGSPRRAYATAPLMSTAVADTCGHVRTNVDGTCVERGVCSTGKPNGDGCHLWAGKFGRHGYGLTSVDGRFMNAHRAAWIAERGPIPDGLWVLHRCDVRACVNIAHLFLGTPSDNVQDMIAKGRGASGLKNGRGKLSDDDVIALRSCARSNDITNTDLAVSFDVSRPFVSNILAGRRRNPRAFTVVEVLIVYALLGVGFVAGVGFAAVVRARDAAVADCVCMPAATVEVSR